MRVIFRCDPALRDQLPKPVPARAALPEWLRQMQPQAASDMHGGDVRTVKHCPPFIDAMSHGFVMPLACDVRVAEGRLAWDWQVPSLRAAAHPRAPISFHAPAQLEGTPFHRPGQVAVKFNSFWTVELEPGWSLFVTHPVNRPDLPFRLLSGLVDADAYHDVGILFPAVWTDPGFSGVLARGTPIAHCFAVPREAAELVYDIFSDADAERYARTAAALLSGPHHYRRKFRARRSRAVGDEAEEGLSQAGGLEP